MRLSKKWFDFLTEDEEGWVFTVRGRDGLTEFIESGKFRERVEISWEYEGGINGMPSEETAVRMELMEEILFSVMEKDKLAILTGIYTGRGEKTWVFYTRTIRVFTERVNESLASLEHFPLDISFEPDPDWREYHDLYKMKEEGED